MACESSRGTFVVGGGDSVLYSDLYRWSGAKICILDNHVPGTVEKATRLSGDWCNDQCQRETPNYVAIRTRVAADQCHPMEETPPSSWEVSEEEEIKTEEDQ